MVQSSVPAITIPGSSGYPIVITGTIPATILAVPAVTDFVLPAIATSLVVNVFLFAAADDVAVTGYKITENSTPPAAGAAGWSGSAPTTVTASGSGVKTFYPWVKDIDGNVSAVYGDPQMVEISGFSEAAVIPANALGAISPLTASFARYMSTEVKPAMATGFINKYTAVYARYMAAEVKSANAIGSINPLVADYFRITQALTHLKGRGSVTYPMHIKTQ